ncbi:dTMP kinase [Victivallis sp. Marseille-Q1083]|uniref:dTMP kinase n=1 Tax=Victivallis sp. Marseille-Q1083 TaxID=2717288 RepID=UPI00158C1502|nr:dTMP kinase [Victivallis sp. Marseille-Q1083]
MSRGSFITFEGPEGAGKTLQIQLLQQSLMKRNIDCLVTREPGGTPLAEEMRRILKFHQGEEPVFDTTELLLFSASRSQHVRFRIEPALAAGRVVLCDRFTDSTLAYQGYGRGLDLQWLRCLNDFATGGLRPDLTLLLDIAPEVSLERTGHRAAAEAGRDRIENAGQAFHRRVRDGFLALAAAEPGRIRRVDGARPVESVRQEIEELVHAIV